MLPRIVTRTGEDDNAARKGPSPRALSASLDSTSVETIEFATRQRLEVPISRYFVARREKKLLFLSKKIFCDIGFRTDLDTDTAYRVISQHYIRIAQSITTCIHVVIID